jgi:hypothetical protein
MKFLNKFKTNETLLAGIVIFVILIIFIVWNNRTPNSFRCPNEYTTVEEYVEGMGQWANEELNKNPKITKEGLLKEREKLFYKHNCEKSRWTISNIN